MNTSERTTQRTFTGIVESNKMEKTIVVRVDRTLVHPKYGKRYVRSQKFHVHTVDAHELGEKVMFKECRPFSKTKRWIVVKATV